MITFNRNNNKVVQETVLPSNKIIEEPEKEIEVTVKETKTKKRRSKKDV